MGLFCHEANQFSGSKTWQLQTEWLTCSEVILPACPLNSVGVCPLKALLIDVIEFSQSHACLIGSFVIGARSAMMVVTMVIQ